MSETLGSRLSKIADLHIAGFQLWVQGREFQKSKIYDDTDRHRVTAHCAASGSSIWTQGAILTITDIANFGNACAAMLRESRNEAVLSSLKPGLEITLEAADHLDRIYVQIDITPDHLCQTHMFKFEIDQKSLQGIVQDCSSIVRKYPHHGNEGEKDA